MNRKSIYWGFLFSIVLSSLIFILGLDRKNYTDHPVTVYQVYLNGKSLGIIEDADELYDLIDKEQENLKKEYKVNKIYAPIGLEITKLVTYEGNVDRVENIYDKIKDVEPFTVKGYEITISKSEEDIKKINILKKEDFDEAIDNTIKAFVNEESYQKYLDSKQDEIITTGTKIEGISLKENITVKEKYISTEDEIYTDSSELSKYMLFGTKEAQGTHVVTAGQTIKDIADEHELNVQEFLIVNPEIISEKTLLFPGQEVNVGLVNPLISVTVTNTLVEDAVVPYGKEIKYDNKYMVGTSWTEQQGRDGLHRVTYLTETINGTTTRVEKEKEEILTPAINEIVIKGGLSSNYFGNTSNWAWPTLTPYKIVSYFGWRTDPVYGGRAFHRGIDITGPGYGSKIFAAKEGVITRIGYAWDMGNYIFIRHGEDNIQTGYLHLSRFEPGLKVGSYVEKKQVIGYMGSTGKSTGTHLDFRIMYNGQYSDPLVLEYDQ